MKNLLKQKLMIVTIIILIHHSNCMKRGGYGDMNLNRYNPIGGPDYQRGLENRRNIQMDAYGIGRGIGGQNYQQHNNINDLIARNYAQGNHRDAVRIDGKYADLYAKMDRIQNDYGAYKPVPLNNQNPVNRPVNRLNMNAAQPQVDRPQVHNKCKMSFQDFDAAFGDNTNVPGSNGIENLLANGKFIGRGSFGEVKEISWMNQGRRTSIAVKKIDLNKDIKGIKRELRYGLDFNISTLPKFYGCLQAGNHLYIFQEKLYKDLSAYDIQLKIRNRNAVQRAANYISIMNAVKEISDNNVVHSDLKPANMMVKDEAATIFKAVDMGMADSDGSVIHGGTPFYEAMDKKNYGTVNRLSDDVWAVALIIGVLESSQSTIGSRIPDPCIVNRMTDSCYQQLISNVKRAIKSDHDPRFTDLIVKMLAKDSRNRISIGTAIQTVREIYPNVGAAVVEKKEPVVDNLMRRMERADDNDLRKYAFLKDREKKIEGAQVQRAELIMQTVDNETRQEIKNLYNKHQDQQNLNKAIDAKIQERGYDGYKHGYIKPEKIDRIIQKGQRFIIDNKEYINVGPYKRDKPENKFARRNSFVPDRQKIKRDLVDPAYSRIIQFDDQNRDKRMFRDDAYMNAMNKKRNPVIVGDMMENERNGKQRLENDFIAKFDAHEKGVIPKMGQQELFDGYKDHLMKKLNNGIDNQLKQRKSRLGYRII